MEHVNELWARLRSAQQLSTSNLADLLSDAKCQILVYEKLVMSALDKASEAAEARKIADALTLEAAEAQKKADALTLPAAEVAEAAARMPQRRSNRLGNRTRR